MLSDIIHSEILFKAASPLITQHTDGQKHMAFTFSGGLDLQKPDKFSLKRIKALPTPKYTVIDFSADKGTAFKPLFAQGDHVLAYQCVGEQTAGDDLVPVYSAVSGTVRNLTADENGRVAGMIIRADEEQVKAELSGYGGTLAELTPERIIDIVKKAAIPCRGSRGFAYKKLIASSGTARRFILNLCESEPGVNSRKALAAEDVDEVLDGAKLLMRALDVRRCEIAIEKESKEILNMIAEKIKKNPLFDIRKTKQKYPQDEEITLIYALSGARLDSTETPESSGCVVFDAETAASVYRAVVHGIPYCERVITVEGENLLCPVGTPVSELLEFCDIRTERTKKIISGGPLRGRAFKRNDDPVRADTEAVTVIYAGDGLSIPEMTPCNRCGRCVSVCPSRIIPYRIAELSQQKRYKKCAEYGALACCECGCCDYVCPAYIPIKKLIHAAKQKRSAAKRDKDEAEESI